jgi:hypothetical protein
MNAGGLDQPNNILRAQLLMLELSQRSQEQQTRIITRWTRAIGWMTVLIAIMIFVNAFPDLPRYGSELVLRWAALVGL